MGHGVSSCHSATLKDRVRIATKKALMSKVNNIPNIKAHTKKLNDYIYDRA